MHAPVKPSRYAVTQSKARIFVGQLEPYVTEDDLFPIFSAYGHILHLNVVRHSTTVTPNEERRIPTAFVWYETTAEADAAIAALHNVFTFSSLDEDDEGKRRYVQVSYADKSPECTRWGRWQKRQAEMTRRTAPTLLTNNGGGSGSNNGSNNNNSSNIHTVSSAPALASMATTLAMTTAPPYGYAAAAATQPPHLYGGRNDVHYGNSNSSHNSNATGGYGGGVGSDAMAYATHNAAATALQQQQQLLLSLSLQQQQQAMASLSTQAAWGAHAAAAMALHSHAGGSSSGNNNNNNTSSYSSDGSRYGNGAAATAWQAVPYTLAHGGTATATASLPAFSTLSR